MSGERVREIALHYGEMNKYYDEFLLTTKSKYYENFCKKE